MSNFGGTNRFQSEQISRKLPGRSADAPTALRSPKCRWSWRRRSALEANGGEIAEEVGDGGRLRDKLDFRPDELGAAGFDAADFTIWREKADPRFSSTLYSRILSVLFFSAAERRRFVLPGLIEKTTPLIFSFFFIFCYSKISARLCRFGGRGKRRWKRDFQLTPHWWQM